MLSKVIPYIIIIIYWTSIPDKNCLSFVSNGKPRVRTDIWAAFMLWIYYGITSSVYSAILDNEISRGIHAPNI